MVCDRFEGRILGVGTASGHRFVVGDWRTSPLGAFADVMWAGPGGRRTLLAPNERVAEYVSLTYQFDEVRIVSVAVSGEEQFVVDAGPLLHLAVSLGARTPVGRLLHAVPPAVSTSTWFARLCDPVARVVMPGVRTVGSAGNGRREFYSARDVRSVTVLSGTLDGRDLGELRPVDPPPDFGFSSTPRQPTLTQVVTTVVR